MSSLTSEIKTQLQNSTSPLQVKNKKGLNWEELVKESCGF